MNSKPATFLLQHLHNKIGDARKLCVAFSGGLDSSVLLAGLAELRDNALPDIRLRALHIHHGLSRFADDWVAHCQTFCLQRDIPFSVIKVQVNAQDGGIEAAARTARYQAFSESLTAGEVLLTAQHLNDQCETFMLALKRGSGPAGLSAMSADSSAQGYRLLRPLLDLSRNQLEAYATQHQLAWIEDDSNRDSRFDRNFLRLDILPDLYARWPHFAQATARSALLCAEQEALLDELLSESLKTLTDQQGSLSVDGLRHVSAVRRSALLRRWLGACGARMPSREQLQRIWDEVALSREDAQAQLVLGKMMVRRFRQRLYVLPERQPLKDQILCWDPAEKLELPDGLGCLIADHVLTAQTADCLIRQPRADEKITVRFQVQGIIEKVGRDRARQAKKLWSELGVPPWERDRIPLIYYNDQLMAAPGWFTTRQSLTENNEALWRIVWSAA
ncbi:tRNA lysidine(34) synthetase TilS [Rahnella perminowiae]|uniref:tRNA(Ile)-lysidine synthase n=1 Tax=Rahnella perminowiae TaxID=2816244 RepID=A0ABS6KX22_9GAMM|nr:tRNA lysidine(34) synthetase TilS [Rahnella perminowiae]MBU9834156.1 tRNA lysidine(34) synthetase TilS [Rahnella perminowiae]MCR9002814.1 tRNA lysidine(34) synthetase TilS [Rahnella perminowiae]